MSEYPLISIIVPVYNVSKYLKECLDSLISQTYKKIEIILVDDGSTDESGDICESYAKKYKMIKVIHKNNGGLSSARNAGLDVFLGEYISFVDSDDYVSPDFISKLYSSLTIFNSDISICYRQKFYDGDAFKAIATEGLPFVISQDDFWNHGVGSRGSTIAPWNKLYKKEIFSDIRFPEGKNHEDTFVLHHIISKCDKISVLPEYLYFYRKRAGSIMYSDRLIDLIFALDDRIDFCIKFNYSKVLLKRTIFRQIDTITNAISINSNDKVNLLKIKKYIKTFVKKLKTVDFSIFSRKQKFIIRSFVLIPSFVIMLNKAKLKRNPPNTF